MYLLYVLVQAKTIYLEEDGIANTKFPNNGVFDLGAIPGTKYKVSGEHEVTTVAVEPRQLPPSTGTGWGPSRPW